MLHFECPWCTGQGSVETDGDGDTFRCADCAISVELTGPSGAEVLAAAA